MASIHKRIADPALFALTGDRARYFSEIVRRLEGNPRTDDMANLVYLALRDVIGVVPTYLPHADFIDLLFAFLAKNRAQLVRILFDTAYRHDPEAIRPVTRLFVLEIVDLCMDLYQEEPLKMDEPVVHQFCWPEYEGQEFPYQPY